MATDDGMAPSDEWEDYYNTYEDEENEMNKKRLTTKEKGRNSKKRRTLKSNSRKINKFGVGI